VVTWNEVNQWEACFTGKVTWLAEKLRKLVTRQGLLNNCLLRRVKRRQ
jgi:hypothetical protein